MTSERKLNIRLPKECCFSTIWLVSVVQIHTNKLACCGSGKNLNLLAFISWITLEAFSVLGYAIIGDGFSVCTAQDFNMEYTLSCYISIIRFLFVAITRATWQMMPTNLEKRSKYNTLKNTRLILTHAL